MLSQHFHTPFGQFVWQYAGNPGYSVNGTFRRFGNEDLHIKLDERAEARKGRERSGDVKEPSDTTRKPPLVTTIANKAQTDKKASNEEMRIEAEEPEADITGNQQKRKTRPNKKVRDTKRQMTDINSKPNKVPIDISPNKG
jgi:outer membrane receptor for ferric coprogen and ferric-rhodotorulic acid